MTSFVTVANSMPGSSFTLLTMFVFFCIYCLTCPPLSEIALETYAGADGYAVNIKKTLFNLKADGEISRSWNYWAF